MTARRTVTVAAAAAILAVLAQDAAPAWPGFHAWPYAALLALAATVVLRLAKDNPLSAIGALVTIVAGLAAGLLGPDSETLTRPPGTVLPIPSLGAAAFFPNADAGAIARGDSAVLLRQKNGTQVAVAPGSRRFLGANALELRPQVAAYVEARDAHGDRLTVTQPSSASFLSPVLLFPQTLPVVGQLLPADAFATPARNRLVKAFYFSPDATRHARVPSLAGKEAILFAVDNDSGRALAGGIGFGGNRDQVRLAGLRLRATLGTYPALVVSAVPYPLALVFGLLVFLAGALLPFVKRAAPAFVPAVVLLAALPLTSCTTVGTKTHGGLTLHPWTHPDTLRIGLYEEPDSLNPVIGSMAFASDVFQLVFDGLIRYDDKGRPIPDLALAVPTLANGGISRDGKTISYRLARNVRWSDGVPFTAADVVYTWRQMMNPNNLTVTRNGYDRIVSIETPDPYTLRLHLSEPYAPALYLFRDLNQGAIVPKHVLEKTHDFNRDPFNAKPVGTGPYVLKSWTHGGDMRFDANPAYFRGKPKIPHISLKFIRDQNTLLAQLKTHEIDLYYGVPAFQMGEIRKIDGIKTAQVSTLHWEHLAFNTQRPPLDEKNVRLALCYGFDEEGIYQKVYHGLGAKGPIHFNPDFPWALKGIRHYPFDPGKAAALLDAAGWKMGPGGVRQKNGRPLSITISTVAGVKNREAIEVILQSEWRAIGVDLTVKNFPAATLFAPAGAGGLLYAGKVDVALFTWVNNTPDPDDETYISPERLPPKGQNVSFFKDARIGRWQRAALRTYDPVQRRAYYDRIQRVLIDEVPEYVLDWLPEITAANVDLQGVRPVPVGSDLWNIQDWSFGG